MALLVLVAPSAHAERGKSIAERPRSDYDAMGILFGGFIVRPSTNLGMENNDNIYASATNAVSDTITVVTPEIDIKSDWNRHNFNLVAGAKSGTYSSNSDENYLDAKLLMNGRLDVQRESFLTGSVGIQRLHEERNSPDSSNAFKNPAEYTQSSFDMSYMQGLGRTSLTAGAGVATIDYSTVSLTSGGSDDLRDRDRCLYNMSARAAYELLPNVSPFLVSRYEWRAYDQSDTNRDSEGYRLGIGTGFDLGGVTTGEIFAGYMQQDFEKRENISGSWFGLSVLWNVTQLTSIQARAESAVKETTMTNSSGINAIDTGLRIDHELLRDLLIGGFSEYSRDEYQSVDTVDQLYSFGPRITYLVNRYLKTEASYAHQRKESTDPTREYSENVFLLSVTGQY